MPRTITTIVCRGERNISEKGNLQPLIWGRGAMKMMIKVQWDKKFWESGGIHEQSGDLGSYVGYLGDFSLLHM